MLQIRAVVNLILVAAVIFISYYSSIVGINEQTQDSVSAAFSSAFTPAAYAFSIWGAIFIMLIIVAVKDLRGVFLNGTQTTLSFNAGLSLALVLTFIWVFVWSYLQIGWSLVVMTAIFVSLIWAVLSGKERPVSANITLALYLGWISVALVANEAAWLVSLDLVGENKEEGFLHDPSFSVMQSALTLVVFALVMSFKSIRHGLEPAVFVYPLVGVWAYIAILIKNGAGNPNLLVYVSAFFALILLLIAGYFGSKWNSSYSATTKD
ncbi:TspO/MBR family protein [Kangiella shandongensis]|uniref:TspO/MBR family protein n=1 Tax=Kangiella shandongensis TaxID=2763258 RepID=UPI001CBF75BE|nr:TspO/MBR family protein [Kangiella shandongensis]